MVLDGQNHYELLGVPQSATPDEIKRAWARLVRVHSPDKDPEGNRRINEAKSTLLDVQVRQDYDALLEYGDEITSLLEDASNAEGEEDWDQAVGIYTEILAFHPSNHAVRNKLALCQSYAGNSQLAIKTLEQLTQKVNTVALYWSNLGHVILGECEEDDALLLARARHAFEKAAELEPYNAAHHIALSRYWRKRKDFRKAEHHIELAVNADGKVELDDIEALLELPWIHLFAKEHEKVKADAKRIRDLIPEDNEDARRYAAFQFLEIANMLVKQDLHQLANNFIKASEQILALPTELKEWAKSVEETSKIIDEGNLLKDDVSLDEYIRSVALVQICVYLGEMDTHEARKQMEKFLRFAFNQPNSQWKTAISQLKRNYPNVYGIRSDFFDQIATLGTDPYTRRPGPTGGPGCVLIVLTLVLTILGGCCMQSLR
jgi:curved DNA-binding protein CbpA